MPPRRSGMHKYGISLIPLAYCSWKDKVHNLLSINSISHKSLKFIYIYIYIYISPLDSVPSLCYFPRQCCYIIHFISNSQMHIYIFSFTFGCNASIFSVFRAVYFYSDNNIIYHGTKQHEISMKMVK